MNATTLRERLKKGGHILMDGAMGTEILNRDVATTLPLWSAEALLSNPDVIRQIHEDYIEAGAEIIITNTFSTTERMLAKKNLGGKAKEATILACRLANEARKTTGKTVSVAIAGSVAPLEDCYSPELTPSDVELRREHGEFARWLKEDGTDFILIETMITVRETLAACEAAKDVGLPVAVSFCCNDQLKLLGGETLAEAIQAIEPYDPLFIGVNCVSTEIAAKAVPQLKKLTDRPIAAYAQGDGEPDDDQGWCFTHGKDQQTYLTAAQRWLTEGAQVIGGCCGTTPSETAALRKLLLASK